MMNKPREVPRWFPPGYPNRWFWLVFVTNLGAVLSAAWVGSINATQGNDKLLFMNVAGISANGLTLYFCCIRRAWRDSKDWRKGGRDQFIKDINEHAQAILAMVKELDPLMRQTEEIVKKHMEKKNDHRDPH
jgi:hypothetical protein